MSSEDHTVQYRPILPYVISHCVTFYSIFVNVNIPVVMCSLLVTTVATQGFPGIPYLPELMCAVVSKNDTFPIHPKFVCDAFLILHCGRRQCVPLFCRYLCHL